ncbi:MAG TPA: hypothetical protein VE267_18045 [Bradyrhizobium sp.]|nr:hypothetical protein [Bradyrhizobium sp.]
MVLKNAFAAALCTGLLALCGAAMADEYRPDEYFGLDLSKAVLSPKRLGPETQFAPVPVEAKADRGSDAQARAEPATEPLVATRKVKTVHISAERPRAPARVNAPAPVNARAKLARRHRNPLDAEAHDTRVQTWPCRSGGICNWQR